MAILTGFPPSNTISASVRITEKDQSFIAPEQSFHRAGLVGFASKGPINVPTLIQTSRQLHTIFGQPHPDVGDPYLIYAAEQYLLVASELYVVRVAEQDAVNDEAAETASVSVSAAGSLVEIISDTAELYTFSVDSFFRWRLNGVLSSKTLVVLSDDNRPSPDTGSPYTAQELADDLNAQLTSAIDGIEFFVSGGDKIGVRTTFAYGPSAELELVSVQDAIYGGTIALGNPTGLGTGMTQASEIGSSDRYPLTGYQGSGKYDLTGLTGLNIQIVVDGTDNVLIDNIVQTIDLGDLEGVDATITEVVTELNSQKTGSGGSLPGGWEAFASGNNLGFRTLHHGRDAKLLIKSDSTAEEIFGLETVTNIGTSPQGTTDDAAIETYGIVNGKANTDGDVTFTINAESAGIDGNSTQVVITNDTREGVFNIEVYNNAIQVESWGNLVKDQTSRFYVETFITLVSDYIRVDDNTLIGAGPLDGTYDLSGGSDGLPADPDDQDDILIGSEVAFTGIFTLSEPEQIDIDLIAVPGHSSTAVVTELIRMCENFRQDCLAIIDPPFGLTVNEIVDWQNGTHPLNLTRFDTDFAALYWPWVKLRDNFNQVDVWAPPSGSIMAVIARSDFLDEPWFPPAGLERGIVPGINDVFSRPTREELDLMYGNRNAVNPIIQFADVDGFVVWGQKTLQRTPTALDRINVRRLMFIIEKRIRVASRSLLFEPHDEIFRQRFVSIARDILNEIQVGRGINAFIIQADEELNTPDVIDRNEFRARIGIQPLRAVEFIFLEFSVHRTGSFGEPANTF